jgi:hypothetical protein
MAIKIIAPLEPIKARTLLLTERNQPLKYLSYRCLQTALWSCRIHWPWLGTQSDPRCQSYKIKDLADLIRRINDTEHDLWSSVDQPFERISSWTTSDQTGCCGHTFNPSPQKSATDVTYGTTINAADEVITITGYNYDSADKASITI